MQYGITKTIILIRFSRFKAVTTAHRRHTGCLLHTVTYDKGFAANGISCLGNRQTVQIQHPTKIAR